jgi:hypothetical protein
MTITIELSPEEERNLREKAKDMGVEPEDYARRLLGSAVSREKRTGADILSEIKALNLAHGYGDLSIDSPELARRLRDQFSRRKQIAGLDS